MISINDIFKDVENTFKPIKDDLDRILLSSNHKNIFEAITADLVDLIPYVGDAFNTSRIASAVKSGNTNAIFRQVVDNMGSAIPGLSTIVDLLTPTNTINFIEKKFKEQGL